MKVLIDSYNSVNQNKCGGVQVRINQLTKYMKQRNVEVKLFNKWKDNVEDYDILHLFKANQENYNLMMCAKKRGVPVVISSIIPLNNKFKIVVGKYLKKIFKINTGFTIIQDMLEKCDLIIAETNSEKEFIENVYSIDKNKIKVIYNGVDINPCEYSKEIVKSKFGLQEDYVLQVGRFDENKNQINTIKALNKLNITLVLVGDADYKDRSYYDKCREIAKENIKFLGWIDNESEILASLYQEAKVVIVPSFYETFGISLVEGGSLGANLVVSNTIPLINEEDMSKLCEHINPNDITDIANKVNKAFLKEKSEHIKNEFIKKFNWSNIAEEHIKLYEKILEINN